MTAVRICPRTDMQCGTPSICNPFGGCLPPAIKAVENEAAEQRDEILVRLEQVVALLRTIAVPQDDALWNSQQIADWLGLSKVSVELRVVSRDNFPKPLRAVDTKQAQRRWFRSDVIEWGRANAGSVPAPRRGRPRKSTSI